MPASVRDPCILSVVLYFFILLISVCQARIVNQTNKKTRADRGIEKVVTHFKISLFCFHVSIEDVSFVTVGFILPTQAGISL